MNASDFKQEALTNLKGKWGKAVCIVLAYVATFFIIVFVQKFLPDYLIPIFSIITFIIEVPLSLGFIFAFMKLFNDEYINAFDFVTIGFQNFAKSWAISFRILLKMIVPVILVIISFALMIGGLVGATIYCMIYNNGLGCSISASSYRFRFCCFFFHNVIRIFAFNCITNLGNN